MVTLYIHPRCSTCKKAQRWLEKQQVAFETIDLLAQPPQSEAILAWMKATNVPIRRFFNTSGQKYRELGLKDQVPTMNQKAASALLASDGMLLKRPVLLKDNQLLALGFNEFDFEGAIEKS
ncbi:MAG: arsenate reductase family protein [Enterococcus sp.]